MVSSVGAHPDLDHAVPIAPRVWWVGSVLPGDDVGLCVEADAVQLEQVLFNLCLNARDAIGEAGLIKVRLREAGCAFTCASCRAQLPAARWVELSVADNGSGIEPGTLERMFEPFFSTKEVGRGTGTNGTTTSASSTTLVTRSQRLALNALWVNSRW